MTDISGGRPWFWEGNVQGALAAHLGRDGWEVRAAADTASKEPGIDLLATKDGRWLAIEVKGYPTTTYDHGPRKGQPKPTQPPLQARHWYSNALLGMMLLRDKRPDAEVAIAFPRFTTYENLVRRTRVSLDLLGCGVHLVAEDGAVDLVLPHRPVGDAPTSRPTCAPTRPSTRARTSSASATACTGCAARRPTSRADPPARLAV